MPRVSLSFLGNRDIAGEGKYLMEIATQLRGSGEGRVLTRGEWERRWPQQPSFIRLTQVRPAMDRWLRHGVVWGHLTWRGRHLGLHQVLRDLDRPDWRLIPRREEDSLIEKAKENPWSPKALPSHFPLPPLLRRFTGDSKVEAEHVFDPEHSHFVHLLEKSERSQVLGDLYDVDPQIYLDFYGSELPRRVDEWERHQ